MTRLSIAFSHALRFGSWAVLAALAFPLAWHEAIAAQAGLPAGMPVKERQQLLQAAGFDLTADGRTVMRSCGESRIVIRPAIAMTDFNGDGRAEAVILSQTDCDTVKKLHSTIVHRDARGIWQNAFDADGAIRPAEGRTDGWLNLDLVDGATIIPFVHDREAGRYARLDWVHYRQHLAQAIRPARTAPGALPTAGWTAPYSIGNLTPDEIAQIFTVVGYKRVGGSWKGCDGTSDAEFPADDNVVGGAPIIDLNGDGNPEVIVRDDGSECYGNSGGQFNILTPVPGGWKSVANGQDSPSILPARSRAGWRDIVDGGPGFCHSRYRNDGKGYQRVAAFEEAKGACSRQ